MYFIVVFYYVITTSVVLLLQTSFGYKSYELVQLSNLFDVVFIFLVYIAFLLHENREKVLNNTIWLALFSVVFIGSRIGNNRANEARKIKDGIVEGKKDHLAFQYNERSVNTSDSLLYIGETSTHLFLYDSKDSVSLVYKVSNIENLKIK